MTAEQISIRSDLINLCEREATKLYRLAWRMQAHGCSAEAVRKCREEANELHMTGYPERAIDPFRRWFFAFDSYTATKHEYDE